MDPWRFQDNILAPRFRVVCGSLLVIAVPVTVSLNTPVPPKLSMAKLCEKTPFASVVRWDKSTDTLEPSNS